MGGNPSVPPHPAFLQRRRLAMAQRRPALPPRAAVTAIALLTAAVMASSGLAAGPAAADQPGEQSAGRPAGRPGGPGGAGAPGGAGSASYISEHDGPGRFALAAHGTAPSIVVDDTDHEGVRRVAGDLSADIERVTGIKPRVVIGDAPEAATLVVLGTIGRSALIDDLI